MICVRKHTPPKATSNSLPLKDDGRKSSFLLGPGPFCRSELLNFRGCIYFINPSNFCGWNRLKLGNDMKILDTSPTWIHMNHSQLPQVTYWTSCFFSKYQSNAIALTSLFTQIRSKALSNAIHLQSMAKEAMTPGTIQEAFEEKKWSHDCSNSNNTFDILNLIFSTDFEHKLRGDFFGGEEFWVSMPCFFYTKKPTPPSILVNGTSITNTSRDLTKALAF